MLSGTINEVCSTVAVEIVDVVHIDGKQPPFSDRRTVTGRKPRNAPVIAGTEIEKNFVSQMLNHIDLEDD